jgi:hypothetical protein
MARDAVTQRAEVSTKEFKEAKNVVVNTYGLYEIRKSGNERYIQRQIADKAIAEVVEVAGKNINKADFRALMWYYEKELWSKLGLSKEIEKLDYEQAAEKVSEEYRERQRELVSTRRQVSAEAAGRAQSSSQSGSDASSSNELDGGKPSGARASVGRSGRDATVAIRRSLVDDGRVWSRSSDRRKVGGYDLVARYRADAPEWAEAGVSAPVFVELKKSEKSARLSLLLVKARGRWGLPFMSIPIKTTATCVCS